ncbi:MAG: fumarate reductase/succinate dehydrogenase flavoprotein subunit [Bacteroidetes bacterium]|nr:fumarate reductase/succinate dehydrogenase flavoprotein subunit [Bacteroidota bacterium]MDA1126502.1 fumarate reductase/succinate dehydrogenase flavoprotein subunit [Bacteroidota bacterium]
MSLDAKIPEGPLEQKWSRHKKEMKLVAPNNRRKYEVIIVGTGLAGGAAAASMAEMGYKVKSFCIQDSARRAHSIAAQGGINAAKNYPNDGDSVWRLFYDTIKGGDYRSREANVYRLAEVSNSIIDQAVAQGVPFAREYSGLLANRSFGGAQVSRTFYARGQTGQQLLLGAYQAMMRQVELGGIEYYTRHEMLEVVIIDGKARGIITRDLVTGEICRHEADAVILATGGYGNVFYLSTNAKNSNVTAAWRAHKKGALFANPSFVQVHPTCIPVSGDYQSKLTLMSESLRNDGRVWVPRKKGDDRHPNDIPEDERFYYLEEKYPSFGNLVPRDVASRNAKVVCDQGLGVGETGLAVYLDFRDAIARDGKDVIAAKYGNLFDMYANIAGEDPYSQPMRIFPAVHYTMGGLWVDYNLMTNIPGLFAAGEANFSDHGANRLGASALMQGLSDGYFVLPSTIGNYLADVQPGTRYGTDHEAFETAAKQAQDSIDRLLNINGKRTIIDFHRTLGRIVWDKIGISRTKEGLEEAIADIRSLRDEFWTNVYVPGEKNNYNKYLEFAGRVADFFELAELMAMDALDRDESCGCHLREEFQTEEGEAIRNDEEFNYVSAWEFKDRNGVLEEELHKEVLNFEFVELKQRSYK